MNTIKASCYFFCFHASVAGATIECSNTIKSPSAKCKIFKTFCTNISSLNEPRVFQQILCDIFWHDIFCGSRFDWIELWFHERCGPNLGSSFEKCEAGGWWGRRYEEKSEKKQMPCDTHHAIMPTKARTYLWPSPSNTFIFWFSAIKSQPKGQYWKVASLGT